MNPRSAFALLLTFITTSLALPLASQAALKNQYILQSTTSYPEGITFDPVSRNFFPTALFGGAITRVPADGGSESVFFQETGNPNLSFGGAKVDAVRRILWVCTVDLTHSPAPVGGIYGIRILPGNAQGQLIHSIPLPMPSFCNDIALDAFGQAYATNSLSSDIYKIDPSTNTASVFASSPLLTPAGIGVNGLQVTPDQSHLIVVTSQPAGVYSISIHNPSDVRPVTLNGGTVFVPGDLRLPGPDGLLFVGQKAYIVENGAVLQLTFKNRNYDVADVKTTFDIVNGLSSGTEAFGKLYVIDSQVFPVVDAGLPPVLPFQIVKVKRNLFH